MTPVDPVHRHAPKICHPGPIMTVGGATLKWSEIHASDADISDPIRTLARTAIGANLSGLTEGEAGFVILHRCGDAFYFLLVQTWRHGNELWESVLYKDASMADFAPFPTTDLHRPTFCVWEMACVWHETQAWRCYLLSTRDSAAFTVWATDTLNGPV